MRNQFLFYKSAVEVIIMALLIVLSTLSMAWFFSANSAALDGLNRLPDNVRVIVNDTQLFIDNTENQLRYVTNNNLNEFMKNIDNDINDVSDNLTGTIDGAIEDIHFYQMVNMIYKEEKFYDRNKILK